jgi:hypothetical protein
MQAFVPLVPGHEPATNQNRDQCRRDVGVDVRT